jgi:hypothetical protein
MPQSYGYSGFSAAYGNIYTVRQMVQLVRRATGDLVPVEDRWQVNGRIIDPFRPGLAYPAVTDAEFDALQRQHFDAVVEAIRSASVLVLTLGLTEAWRDRRDGCVFPACPGTVAGTFDPDKHEFINFGFDDVRADLLELIDRLRALSPTLRLIITVSPVPLVATAEPRHVVGSTIYSKSVLRAVAEEVSRGVEGVKYFPAYEIVTGPQAPADFFEPDRRDVSKHAIETVMAALLASSERPRGGTAIRTPATSGLANVAAAAQRAVEAECEEELMDPARTRQRGTEVPPTSSTAPRTSRAAVRAKNLARQWRHRYEVWRTRP